MNKYNIIALAAFLIAAVFAGCGNQVSEAAAGETDNSRTASQDVAVTPPAPPEDSKSVAAASSQAPDAVAVDTQEMVIDEEEATPATGGNGTADDKPNAGDASGEDAAQPDGDMTPELIDAEGVKLNSIILARGVDKREPVEPGTQFAVADGEKIYAIMDVSNSTEDVAELTVSWKMPDSDKEIGKTSLEVKAAKSWRTWSFTRWARKSGTWEAIVRNANGDIIARAPFQIVE